MGAERWCRPGELQAQSGGCAWRCRFRRAWVHCGSAEAPGHLVGAPRAAALAGRRVHWHACRPGPRPGVGSGAARLLLAGLAEQAGHSCHLGPACSQLQPAASSASSVLQRRRAGAGLLPAGRAVHGVPRAAGQGSHGCLGRRFQMLTAVPAGACSPYVESVGARRQHSTEGLHAPPFRRPARRAHPPAAAARWHACRVMGWQLAAGRAHWRTVCWPSVPGGCGRAHGICVNGN